MSNESLSVEKQIKESIKELTEIYEELEKKGAEIKRDGKDILNDLKKDISYIKRHFEEIVQNNENSMADKVQSLLGEIKPFIEKLLHDTTATPIVLSDVIDISALKLKLAAIHARIYIKQKAADVINKLTGEK